MLPTDPCLPAHRELQPGVKAVQVVLRYEQHAVHPGHRLFSLLRFAQYSPVSPCLPRICYSDTSCPQEDQYPPNIAVKVNHTYCSVPVSKTVAAW